MFCGSTEYLQCCHLIPASEIGSRWKKWNAITLCAKHHKWDRIFSFHYNPVRFFKWFEEQQPERWKIVKGMAYGSIETRNYKEVYEELREVNLENERICNSTNKGKA
jgi:hypothetical protein